MNRKIVWLTFLSVLLLSSLNFGVRFIKPVGASTTRSVDDEGPSDFYEIQEDNGPVSVKYWSMQAVRFHLLNGLDGRLMDVFELPFDASDRWGFENEVEWTDFAYIDDDSVELVIGLSGMRPNSYVELLDLVMSYGGGVVSTVSMDGKVSAVVADIPHVAMSTFVSKVEVAGLSRYVEPNMRFEIDFIPNDPDWPMQWGPRVIEADDAWDTQTGDPSVLVAVIDTGIDWNHPDLAANYVPLGYDWVNNDPDPMDDHGHGTHCAGIIAAVLDNYVGIAGLAQVQVMAEKGLDRYGGGYEDDLANAIIHAVDQGADIISMSWGGSTWGTSVLVHEAVKYAYDRGVLLVAAAGNEATDMKSFPAGYDEVIAVTATDEFDDPAFFTNFGEWVELAAPGVDIYSTVWDDSYTYMSGTSMSCPHVAGVAALIWSQFPSMNRNQVWAQLRYTSYDLGDPGFDVYYGYGRINAREAVEVAPLSHDLVVFGVQTPSYLRPNSVAIINSTVLNFGTSDESNIAVQLLINSSLEDSTIIDFLANGASKNISFSWSPTVEGTYNVTSHVVPVAGETITGNNALSTYVIVRVAEIFRVPEDYLNIQEAIDVANPGDIIEVAAGTYSEHVMINKSVTLVGEDRSTTLIGGGGTGTVVRITADRVNISRFTIQNGATGINLQYSCYNVLRDISMISNGRNFAVDGRFILHFIHDIDTSNTVDGKPICYLVNQDDKEVPVDAGYVAVVNSTNIFVRDLNLTRNSHGVLFAYTTGSNIENVTTFNNDYGICLVSSNGNNVSSNTISKNQFNIQILYSDNNIINDNIMSKAVYIPTNLQAGISLYLRHCSGNTICGNTINSNERYGVYDDSSINNTFYGNDVLSNDYGIYAYWSKHNTLASNTALNNTWGIYLDWSSCNILRDNNLTDNLYNLRVSGSLLSDFIHNMDTSNTVNGKPVYYLVDQENLIIDPSTFPSVGYLGLVNSTDFIVKNLNLTKNGEGLLLAYTTNSLIENVDASNNYYGFYLCGSSGNNISSNTAANNTVCGIYLKSGSKNNTLLSNVALENKYGIYLQGCDENTLLNNMALNNGNGIVLYYSGGNILRDNNMTGNEYNFGIDGYFLSQFIQDMDTSNTVDGKPIYYWVNQQSKTIPTNAGYVALINSTRITVKNLNLVNNLQGVLFAYTTNSTIMNVIVSNNGWNGIYFIHSHSNTIGENSISDNFDFGIYLYYSDGNTITGSTLIENGGGIDVTVSQRNVIDNNTLSEHIIGIMILYSDDNVLSGNKVIGGTGLNGLCGMTLTESNGNILSGNTVSDNRFLIGAGIYLEWYSNNNTIIQNTITNNQYGINLGSFTTGYCNNNTVYHNNFNENMKQVLSLNSINTWDNGYPSGGNYWSDYGGVDLHYGPYQNLTGSDGIGDEPYVMDGDNRDRYPLMGRWPPLIGDVNLDGKVDISDIFIAALAFGSYPGHPDWSPAVDINNDDKIDIQDIYLIAINFGKTSL